MVSKEDKWLSFKLKGRYMEIYKAKEHDVKRVLKHAHLLAGRKKFIYHLWKGKIN